MNQTLSIVINPNLHQKGGLLWLVISNYLVCIIRSKSIPLSLRKGRDLTVLNPWTGLKEFKTATTLSSFEKVL